MSCCDFHSGMLRERVTLQRRTSSGDGYGGTTEAWIDDPSEPVAAQLKFLSGTEAVVAQRLAPTAVVRCTIRFRGDASGNPYYTPGDRLIHRGRTFNILSAFNKNMEFRWIEMLMSEGRPS